MKRILNFLLAFFAVLPVFAQDYPDTTKIPAQWKKESIILLTYQQDYDINFSGKNTEYLHMVYYIRDKWGLDEMSVLDLPAAGKISDSLIGKIYKRNGKVIPIQSSHLIPRKTTIDFSNSKSRSAKGLLLETSGSQKLAVPSLEVGDIIEVSFTKTEVARPSLLVLINKFPVLHFTSTIKLYNAGYGNGLNYKLFYKQLNSETYVDANDTRISVTLDSLDKYKEEILNDNNKQVPYLLIGYKYASSYSSGSAYGNYKKMESQSAQALQIAMVRDIYEAGPGQKTVARQVLAGLNKKYAKITDTAAFVRDAYYLYREAVCKTDVFNGLKQSDYRDDKFFTSVMTRVLFAKKIKHKVFMTQPDYFGTVKKPDDFIDTYYGVFLPSQNLYLFNPIYAYDPGNVPAYFENQDLISFSANKYYKRYRYMWVFWIYPPAGLVTLPVTLPIFLVKQHNAKKNRKYDFDEGRFPASKAESNSITHELTVKKIDYANTALECERKSSFSGKIKLIETNKICDASYMYENAENPYSKMLYNLPPKFKTDTAKAKKLEKYLDKVVTADLDDDGFNVEKLTSFKVDETNFFETTKPFTHTSHFKANDMVWHHNDYIVLQAGRLIGSQLIVPEKSKDRRQNFYIPYHQQINCKISIPVPDGYAVQNLADFNVKKNTSAGGFISEASQHGNMITLTVKKNYAFSFYPAEDASDIYDFLYEAEKYYNKKMIFKKKV